MATAKKKIDPFKVVSSAPKSRSKCDFVEAPKPVKKAIDDFSDISDQIENLKGQQTAAKDTIEGFARSEYAKRSFDGTQANFKMSGNDATVTWICSASSGTFDKKGLAELKEKGYKAKAIDDLLRVDMAAVRINPELYTEFQDEINEALHKILGDRINEFFVFKKTVTKSVLKDAVKHVKSPDKLQELYKDFKVRAYIKNSG